MYRVTRDSVKLLTKILFGLEVIGHENILESDGAIIAANHVSFYDPIVVASAIKRPVHFMAKAELFKSLIPGWFLRQINVFPVRRGVADRNAIRQAINLVKNKKLLGIFPEGTRNRSDDSLPLQGGASLIAIKTGAPIIPVVVTGTNGLRLRKKISVYIGEPIQVSEGKKVSREEISDLNLVISDQFAVLGKQES